MDSLAPGRRVLLLVLDGLGIGPMLDVEHSRPQDMAANTLAHIMESVRDLSLPNLARLGLGRAAPDSGLPLHPVTGAYGKSLLAYSGADTYMGHQEIMGTIPGVPRRQLMREVRESIRDVLVTQGHVVEEYLSPSPMLLVDGHVVVHDNMETDPGRNINVTASYDEIPVEDIVAIGESVRSVVDVSRVIVVMGSGFATTAIQEHIKTGPDGTIGVDSPGLGVYNERYRVRHLGIGVDVRRQLPGLAVAAGMEVRLLGKAADVVECRGAVKSRDVGTPEVLGKTLDSLAVSGPGLIVSNVQEGDLAGHAEDPGRWANVLRQVDEALPSLFEHMRPSDLLLITGDHGNDPTIGHSQHTREETPVLAYGHGVRPTHLGTRTSLADVAATASEFLGLSFPQDGTSFCRQLFTDGG